jgi:Flp pilus assembly pilin Flp
MAGRSGTCPVGQILVAKIAIFDHFAWWINVTRAERVCVHIMLQRFWRDKGGASLIEYSILVALITVLVVLAVAVAGAWAQRMWAHLLPLLG